MNKMRKTVEFAVWTARIHEAGLALRYMPHALNCEQGKCASGDEPCLRPRQIARILRLKQELETILEGGAA